jgi:hypothetical protein
MTTEQDYGGDMADVVEKIRLQEIADQQAATDKAQSEQTTTTTTESTEGKTEGTTEGDGSTTAAAPAAADQQGDVRGALRASRRAERQARDEAARLKAELEEARKQIPAPKDDGVTDAELAELEADMPLVAKALKETRALKASLPKAAAPAPAPAEPEFIPPTQPTHVQDAIDDIPDLLSMQSDPDQSAFNLAVQTDALLRTHPKWADKPLAERLAECARRVKAELGPAAAPAASAPAPQPPAAAPAPASTRRDPAAAVAKAEKVPPSTLSDIAGGAAPTTDIPGLKQFMNMSDEDIKEQLRIHG